jgi:hypothetical protein
MKQDPGRQPQIARSILQETRDKMQDTRESLAFVQAFIAETRAIARPDAEDEAQVTQMMERAAEPRAKLASDTLRRLIARVECLA